MSEILKPCPFCSGKAEIREVETRTSKIGGYFVFCPKCKTSGDNYSTSENAAQAWNKRKESS